MQKGSGFREPWRFRVQVFGFPVQGSSRALSRSALGSWSLLTGCLWAILGSWNVLSVSEAVTEAKRLHIQNRDSRMANLLLHS